MCPNINYGSSYHPIARIPSLNESVDSIEKKVKLYLAMMLYKERETSLERAAKFAGISLEGFLYELSKHRISVFNYSPKEFREELSSIQ